MNKTKKDTRQYTSNTGPKQKQYLNKHKWTGPLDGQPWSKVNGKYKNDNPETKRAFNSLRKTIVGSDGKKMRLAITDPLHPDYNPDRHWSTLVPDLNITRQFPKNTKSIKLPHPMLNKIREEDKEIYAVSDNKQSALKQGFVYVLSHPKFSPWCKIGHSRDPERRLSTYNTGCPTRSYTLDGYEYFEDRVKIEEHIHNIVERDGYTRKGEWFNCPSQYVLDLLKQFPFK